MLYNYGVDMNILKRIYLLLLFQPIFIFNIYSDKILNAIAKNRNEDAINYINELNNIEITDPKEERTYLGWACQKGNLTIVKYLIEAKNANLESVDKSKSTPLILASRANRLDVVTYLLEQNANLEAQDIYGWTALMWAIYKKNINVVVLLVNKNADLYATDKNGDSPFTLAMPPKGSKTIFKILKNKVLMVTNSLLRNI